MKEIRFLLTALALLAAQAAFGQDYARPGLYAVLNGVASIDNFDNAPSGLFDTGIGASGRLGFRLNPRFAVEGQVEYSGDFVDCCGVDLSATLVTANGKFFLMQDQVQPFLLWGLGGAFANTNVIGDENSFVVKVGGGIDFYMGENFGLTGEATYNIATGDLDDFDYLSIGWGLFYRF